MIFGYSVDDLLLFDLEVLKSSYATYIHSNQLTVYLAIVINLFLIYYLRKSISTAYFYLGYSWAFPGYLFFIKKFKFIYWPAEYAGYFCLAMGTLLIAHAFNPKNTYIAGAREQIFFGGLTLTPTLVSYFLFSAQIWTLGTSSIVAALGTMSLFLFQKTKRAMLYTALSSIWILISLTILYSLL